MTYFATHTHSDLGNRCDNIIYQFHFQSHAFINTNNLNP